MRRPYCIGLTGGIGSGKSTVAGLFLQLGAGVVDTDDIARQLTTSGGGAMTAIAKTFGPGVIQPDGSLDRAAMRQLIFGDSQARNRLEAILHPLIRQEAAHRVEEATEHYVLLVVPLLVETQAYGDLIDRILVVDCDEARQIERTMKRDGLTEAAARAVLSAQASRLQRLERADDIVDNQGDLNHLKRQVETLHRHYQEFAATTLP